MKKLIYSIIAVMVLAIIISVFINVVQANSAPQILYSTHVQDIGWQGIKTNGEMSGTQGKSKRLEAIRIKLDTTDYEGGIEYSTHVQEIGWQGFVKNDEIAGTSGKSYRLEAIKIRLTGKIAQYYDVYYRVHAQEFGWLDWAKNGQEAGTSGYSYRLEGIEIRIIKKGEQAPGKTANPYKNKTNTPVKKEVHIKYSTHVQEIGWQKQVEDGKMAGTSGKSYRLEAIKINLSNNDIQGDILYRTHVQEIGWQDWKRNGEVSGTDGKSLRLEAIEIKLTGKIENEYDVYYRTHIQEKGWQDWKKNGEMAGTSGKSLRLEAIEIKLVKKEKQEISILHGIDVSTFNKTINWTDVKKDGIQFAMVRVGYRGYGISSDGIDGKLVEDVTYRYNIKGAIDNNIPVGVYFFSQAKTEQEAIEEAKFVLERIKNYKITYPVAIDTEMANGGNGRADKLTKQERTKVVESFCKTIKSAGYKPMIYTGKNFANNNLNMEELSQYDLWLAHYTGATQDDPLSKPSNYNGNYTMWQYTSNGSVSGIDGRVDRNIYFKQNTNTGKN